MKKLVVVVLLFMGCAVGQKPHESKEVLAKKAQAEQERVLHIEKCIKEQRTNLPVIKKTVIYNAIDNPEAQLVVFNKTGKVVDAFMVNFLCTDNYGKAVRKYRSGSAWFRGIFQSQGDIGIIKPGNQEILIFTLFGQERTTQIGAVKVYNIHYNERLTKKFAAEENNY